MKKPASLKKGDLIAIISPSWGGPSVFPEVFGAGVNALKDLGFKVKLMPFSMASEGELYNNPKKRAEDINEAFRNKEIKGIICSIGGDDSIRILKYLDLEIIKKNPKFFMGYSDSTTINTYLNQLGLVTFNGPTIMAGFSEWNNSPEEYKNHINDLLFKKTFSYPKFSKFSHKYTDWSKVTPVKYNKLEHSPEIKIIQGVANAEGELFGGCIEVLEFMKSTNYWPKPEFWNNKLLFFETSEEKPSPDNVMWMLRNYGIQGILDRISGILFGRCRDYTEEENIELFDKIKKVVSQEFFHPELLVAGNLDFGHTIPQIILPLGVKARFNINTKKLELLEEPFE